MSSQPTSQPHGRPTQRSQSSRFYIPTSSSYVSPTIASSSISSLAIEDQLFASSPTPHGNQSGGGRSIRQRRTTGQSLAALATALQSYRVPSPPPQQQDTIQKDQEEISSMTEQMRVPSPHTPPARLPMAAREQDDISRTTSHLRSAFEVPSQWSGERESALDIMDALVEIHRVLYRGREDKKMKAPMEWEDQVGEVERVVNRWFEGDCGEL